MNLPRGVKREPVLQTGRKLPWLNYYYYYFFLVKKSQKVIE